MNRNPKLSVIVDVYNDEARVEDCLVSVLGQSLSDIEVLCVDRGSTDTSTEIVQKLMGDDERVQLLRYDGAAVGIARNAALQAAKGDYIHFLQAGDCVLDYAYEALVNKLKRYDLDCIKFCSVVHDDSRSTIVENNELGLKSLREGDFNRVFSHNTNEKRFVLPVEAWTGIYKRSFLEEHNVSFIDLKDECDTPFSLFIFALAPRMAASLDRLVVHRVDLSVENDFSPAEKLDLLKQKLEVVRILKGCSWVDAIDPDVADKMVIRECATVIDWCRALSFDDEVGMTAVELTGQLLDEFSQDEAFYYAINEFRGLRKEACWHHSKVEEARRLLAAGVELPEELTSILDDTPNQSETPHPRIMKFFHDACEKPKVSVVVPIYNQEEYLNQALCSLTDQTLEEMEFICVNDGSTDESMTILREYANVDKRFRIIDKANTGYGNTMNVGIDAACGEYLGILEPDDFVSLKMYRALYNVAVANDLDFVKANFHRFWTDENGDTKKHLFHLSTDDSYYKKLVNTSEDTKTFSFVMNTWSGIYKLSFLNKWHIRHNETPGASYQDNGFWFQTFARATRAWFVPTPYYMNRRDNPNSSMFDKGKFYAVTNEYKFIEDWLNANAEIKEKFEPILYKKKLSNFVFTYYRIAREYKREYLEHFRDEFAPLLASGKLDEELVGTLYWKMLHAIVDDPGAFCDKLCVSVIIPAYNARDYIGACLDSILARDAIRIEVICVDDGSTDDTLSILNCYAENDARVRVITQENSGAGAARNTGMRYATGESLAFLDADDFFEPDMLRMAYEKAYSEDADVVVFRSDNYNEKTNVYSAMPYTIQMGLLPHERPFAGIDIEYNIFKAFVGWPWDKLFRTEFVKENGLTFQKQRTTNDLLFVFSAIVKAQRISICGSVLAHHRRLDAGESLSVSRELSWDCFYRALCALRDQLKQWNLFERFEQDFVNYALHSCLWNINTLRGKSYNLLYDRLKDEWLDDLGILDKNKTYFYAEVEYEQLQNLLEMDAEDYLFSRFATAILERNALNAKVNTLNNQIERTQKQVKTLRARVRKAELKAAESNAALEAMSQKSSSEARDASMMSTKPKASKAPKQVESKNAEVGESSDKSVGQQATSPKGVVTWLPRKARNLVKRKKH